MANWIEKRYILTGLVTHPNNNSFTLTPKNRPTSFCVSDDRLSMAFISFFVVFFDMDKT